MCPTTGPDILPEPAGELKRISAQLSAVIREKIAREGPIPFSRYMEMALYQPGLGYYSAGLQKFGEGGDFVTAPQLGDVFARCLARQVEQASEAIGAYEIVEAGAGSGALAADLLGALGATRPPLRYRILERSAHLRQVQKETLARRAPGWAGRVSWLDKPPEQGWRGVFLANEVLDALAVERFYLGEGGPGRCLVDAGPDGFGWRPGPLPPALRRAVEAIIADLEEKPGPGYRSELNLRLPEWLRAVTGTLEQGLALFIDYGYPRRDYYLPARSDGTLVCHYRHRAHGDPFMWPGLTDISASVDFTALAEAADFCGLEVSGYTTQAMFLLACGLDEILGGCASLPARERFTINSQARRLTLPGEMGERFQVMALTRGLGEGLTDGLRGFSLSDLRYRL